MPGALQAVVVATALTIAICQIQMVQLLCLANTAPHSGGSWRQKWLLPSTTAVFVAVLILVVLVPGALGKHRTIFLHVQCPFWFRCGLAGFCLLSFLCCLLVSQLRSALC